MAKYRKRPIVIEAFQLTKERTDSNSEWPQWLHDAWAKHALEPGALYWTLEDRRLRLTTLEGPQTISEDDWIIKGVNGELYPCKPDIFEKTYDAVEPCSEPKVKLPHMHFMAVSGHAPDRCYTIAESMDPTQTGSYVIPLNPRGEYYDAYAVDVQNCGNPAASRITETVTLTKRIQDDEIQFAMTVGGQEVVFVPQPACPQLYYMGDESDADFKFTLSEVTPLVDDSLDVLLEKTGYVIVGRQRK